MEKLNEVFNYNNNGKEIELTIKEKESRYSCIIKVVLDGKVLAENASANISFTEAYPYKMFLHFDSDEGKETMLCVCDLEKEGENASKEEVEENRKISDYLWCKIQEADFFAPSHGWSMSSWYNLEE